MEFLKGAGRLFYLIDPRETYVETLEDLPQPDYVNQAVPYFFFFIVCEYLIQWYQNKPRARINDGITSLAHGMYLGCGLMLFRGLESYAYVKIYDNWRIYDLPWDSPITWYIAAIGVDFGYYWVHRAAHEWNIFWAQHQVHHSSEDYNLTTALRQSALQGWIAWIFYLPMAFFVPPSIFLIHAQFNLLFQFWIHTEVIDNLGPLEYIFNTPRHHRIHHGSNRWCLDKNYAGALIIWDRMFGTFAAEKPGEKIVYGLVEDVNSFNSFWLQFFYLPKMWSRSKEYPKWSEKIKVWTNGPGWVPGKPRLGDPMDCPEYPVRQKYDPQIPVWQNVYAVVHFFVILYGFDYLSKYELSFNQTTVALSVFYILASLTSIGLFLENRNVGFLAELVRSMGTLAIILTTNMSQFTGGSLAIYLFSASATLLIVKCGTRLTSGGKKDN